MTRMRKSWYRSGTILGALSAGISALLSPAVLAVLPARYAAVGVIAGAVWSQVSERHAIARNGTGQ